jgi:hypothetical protein
MTYLEFLEKVVNEFSKIVKGSVKLEVPVNSFERPDYPKEAYIKVTFNKVNIFICVDCGINSEANVYYRHLCNYGDTESYIGYCVERLQNCLEYQILKLFVRKD